MESTERLFPGNVALMNGEGAKVVSGSDRPDFDGHEQVLFDRILTILRAVEESNRPPSEAGDEMALDRIADAAANSA